MVNIPSPVGLDKYYTKEIVAKQCYEDFRCLFVGCGIDPQELFFIEPSAGNGAFLKVIRELKKGYDLHPENTDLVWANLSPMNLIEKLDFFDPNIDARMIFQGPPFAGTGVSLYHVGLLGGDYPQINPHKLVFLGNPPFGYKSKLATAFINQALKYGQTVGFILPLQLRKWSAQKVVNPKARLILDNDLPEDSFTLSGKDYPVRCCFQVWTTDPVFSSLPDRRLTTVPATNHLDFAMYQYNRTEEAKKYFDHDWDFAVLRQGYGDYTKKYFTKEDCDFKQQWIFFKASSPEVLNNLLSLDFVKLSRKNIGIPGFGKADVVQEYQSLFG